MWGKNPTDKRSPSALFGTPFGGKGDYSQVLTGDAFRRYGVTLNLRYDHGGRPGVLQAGLP